MPALKILARLVLIPAVLSEIVLVYLGINGKLFKAELWVELICLVPFAIAVAAVSVAKLPTKSVVLLILGAGIALQCAAMTVAPTSSDDVNRYIWDAKVQLHGIDPYRYAPVDTALVPLRRSPLFFGGHGCAWPIARGECTTINRPRVHTIYPPVAEGAFVLARLGSGANNDTARPLQILAAITAIGVGLLLAVPVVKNGAPVWGVALWTWCPVTVFELGNNAHIDGLAVLFSVAGLLVAQGNKPRAGLSGLLIGAAILTKLYPAVLLALLWRHRPLRVISVVLGLTVVVYLPHVLAVGTDVIGYLPGYLKEEDYTSGSRFLLLAVIAPKKVLTVLAVAVVVFGAVHLGRRSDPHRLQDSAVSLVGLTLLITTPNYSWYALLLLALVAMSGRLEWLPLAIMPTVALLGVSHVHNTELLRTSCYAVGLVAALIGVSVRVNENRKSSTSPAGLVGSEAR